MKKLVVILITVAFIALSTPTSGEEKKSIDTQMELIRLTLENIQLKEALIARQFKDLRLLKGQLIAQLTELQTQKDVAKKIEKKDTEEE